eukprot:NODE_3543_length_1331_cov_61.702815_g3097_i0.p1 GENE.NODE_3543_length_1331_cov_61.702815_g3097_i0~~NODE_3543_length_1331_cov_61.702815_g3097_i0.p1  ORF type:complete len:278 (+),score=62.50 NODE_3543_length_1331_cov_61.702815_g3097_i0:120-836(+)
MVTFTTAMDALQFGSEVQRSLLMSPWPDSLLEDALCKVTYDKEGMLIWRGLRVRMGMHVGEPQVDVDLETLRADYFGTVVNTAARVEGIAQGGQVCISGELLQLASEEDSKGILPSIVVIKDMGLTRLRGVTDPMPLYSVVPRDLSNREFPPVKQLTCDRCKMELYCPKCDAIRNVNTNKKKQTRIKEDHSGKSRANSFQSMISRQQSAMLTPNSARKLASRSGRLINKDDDLEIQEL